METTVDQVNAARLEWYLKNAPEAILETRSSVVFICSRCEQEVDAKHRSLSTWTIRNYHHEKFNLAEHWCPNCGASGSNDRSKEGNNYILEIGSIPHKKYRVEQFVVGRTPIRGLFGRIKGYNKEDVVEKRTLIATYK